MKRKRVILLLLIIVAGSAALWAGELETMDQFQDNGRYQQALDLGLSLFKKDKPEAALLFRISRAYYEIAKGQKKKRDKLARFKEALEFSAPYLETSLGDKRDRAAVVYWYAVLSSKQAETKGIFESLGNVPNLIKLCNTAIAIDPYFADPYFLKGMIHKSVPWGQYSDKFVMGENFSIAIELDPTHITFLTDFALALNKRNWSVKRKSSEAKKHHQSTDGTPNALTDKEYAVVLLEKALSVYNAKAHPTVSEQEKIKEAEKLLKRLKK